MLDAKSELGMVDGQTWINLSQNWIKSELAFTDGSIRRKAGTGTRSDPPTGNHGPHPIADSSIRPSKPRPLTGFLSTLIDDTSGP